MNYYDALYMQRNGQTDSGDADNVMQVTGEATVSATPNVAQVNVGVVTEGKDVIKVQQKNGATVENVLKAISDIGIPKEDIRTSDYRIDPQYDFQDGKQIFRGYRVTHMLQLKITDINMVGKVIDAAVSNGANSIGSIEFTLDKPEKVYNRALSLAITNSQKKAATIAKTLQVAFSPIPIEIQEITNLPSPPTPFLTASVKAEGTPIEPGSLSISAKVTASYSYKSK